MTAPHFVGRAAMVRWRAHWVFTEPLAFVLPLLNGTQIRFDMPLEYTCDLASTPRAVWWRYDPEDPRWCVPCGFHDLFYSLQIGKLVADALLHLMMALPQPTGADPAPPRIRNLFFAAVLVGGARAYRTAPERDLERRAAWEEWSRYHAGGAAPREQSA